MGKTIKNIITGKEITKPVPVDIEVSFDSGVMITETDAAGVSSRMPIVSFAHSQGIQKKN